MRQLFFVAAILAAVVGCKPLQDKSAAFEQADVERRAEVIEAEQQRSSLETAQDAERAELAAAQGEERSALDRESVEAIASATENSSRKYVARRAERASFQQESLHRLEVIDLQTRAVIAQASTSTKTPALTAVVAHDASSLHSKALTLKDKLPALVQVTSDATWMLTRDSIAEQIIDLEQGIKKLGRRL
ncbi:MAG: hypothetical protein Q8O67_03240 [Deltaproteobacteria bacterium]|nr:hypothetical protein [Deltaproteobacteria bacterium]